MFGTYNEPKIIRINVQTYITTLRPVPLILRLASYQSGVSLGSGDYLIFGGIRDFMDKVKSNAYIYNIGSEAAKVCPKMKYPAYSFSVLLKFPFVYACGGR